MYDGPGRKAFMAFIAIIPFVVISTLIIKGQDMDQAMMGSAAVLTESKRVQPRRRLDSTQDFATQLEMRLCLMDDHTTDAATATEEQMKLAVMEVLGFENEDFVNVDSTVNECTVDGWERRISIYIGANEGSGNSSVTIASEKIEYIHADPGEAAFFTSLVEKITAQDSELNPEATDFSLDSLGFIVISLDSNGDVDSFEADSKSKDVVSIGGTDIWWPWWAWLIYAGLVVCCICPMLFFFFKWRRDIEAKEEGTGADTGKQLAAPAPPSASSANHYNSGEEYKTGQ